MTFAKRLHDIANRFPAHGEILDIDGSRIHLTMQGSGPDIVLLHGASGNLRDMEFSLAGELSRHFRVICIDRPGLGWSEDATAQGISCALQAQLMRAACDRVGVEKPLVLGHSYGGAVALAWALQAPECRGLILLSAASMPWTGGLGPFYPIVGSNFGKSCIVPLMALLAKRERFEAGVLQAFKPAVPPEEYLDSTGTELLLRCDVFWIKTRQVRDLKADIESMLPHYGSISCPVEILHGDADKTVPAHIHAERLFRRLADARLTILKGAGHMPHYSHTEEVLCACLRLKARLR